MTVLLVFAAAVAASAAIIYFIMAVGMKEKTYEEAIAEQRNRPDEHLLLGRAGRATKDKHKDKKVKKTGKKVKEKTDKVQPPPKKAHVVFVQPEVVIADSTVSKPICFVFILGTELPWYLEKVIRQYTGIFSVCYYCFPRKFSSPLFWKFSLVKTYFFLDVLCEDISNLWGKPRN